MESGLLSFRFLAVTCLALTDFLKVKLNPKLSNSHEEGGHRRAFSLPWRVLGVQSRGDTLTSMSSLSLNDKYNKDQTEKKENLPDCWECDHCFECSCIRRQREAGSFSNGFPVWWNHPCCHYMQRVSSPSIPCRKEENKKRRIRVKI